MNEIIYSIEQSLTSLDDLQAEIAMNPLEALKVSAEFAEWKNELPIQDLDAMPREFIDILRTFPL